MLYPVSRSASSDPSSLGDAHYVTPTSATPMQQAAANCASSLVGTPSSQEKRDDVDSESHNPENMDATSPWALERENRIRDPLPMPVQKLSHGTPTSKHTNAYVYETGSGKKVAVSPESRQHLLDAQNIVKSNPATTPEALVNHWNWLVDQGKAKGALIKPEDIARLIETLGEHVSYYEENIRDKLHRNKLITALDPQKVGDEAKIKHIQLELQSNPAVAMGQPILNQGNMVYSQLNKSALAHLMNMPSDSPELPEHKTLITLSGTSDQQFQVDAQARKTHLNISWTRSLQQAYTKKSGSLSIRIECAAVGFTDKTAPANTDWLRREMQSLTEMLKDKSNTRPIWISSKLAEHLRNKESLKQITPGLQDGFLKWPFRAGYSLNPPASKSRKALSKLFPVQSPEGTELIPDEGKSTNRYDQGTSKSIQHDQCSEQRLLVPLYGVMAQHHLLPSQPSGSISNVPTDARLTILSGRCSCMSCMGALTGFAMGNFEDSASQSPSQQPVAPHGFEIHFFSTTEPTTELGITFTRETADHP